MLGQRFLVVDDSAVARLQICKVVSDLGAEYATAENADAALLALAQDLLFDVVLVDRHMPGLSGTELIARLRADQRFSGLTIIVTSADTSLESVGSALQAGADEYLMMPFTPQMLKEKLLLCGKAMVKNQK